MSQSVNCLLFFLPALTWSTSSSLIIVLHRSPECSSRNAFLQIILFRQNSPKVESQSQIKWSHKTKSIHKHIQHVLHCLRNFLLSSTFSLFSFFSTRFFHFPNSSSYLTLFWNYSRFFSFCFPCCFIFSTFSCEKKLKFVESFPTNG